MEEFFHYPQEYLRAVSFAPYRTCIEWVATYECRCDKIPYVFVNPPSQAGFIRRVIERIETCARKTARNISEAIFEWLWSIEQLTSPFYTLGGKSLGYSMTSSFRHPTSWQGSSHFARVIQSAACPPKHTLAHVHKLQNIPPFCHSSSRF